MLFNSPTFLFLFLPIVLAAGLGLRHVCQRAGLDLRPFLVSIVLFSLVFYGWQRADWVLLLVASIAVNYLAGLRLARRPSRAWLAAGVAFNLGLLGTFEYLGFLTTNLHLLGAVVPVLEAALPIGISFYTFQQIAFLVDVHRGITAPSGWARYAFFVSFFPQLIAGPIVHHSEIFNQLDRARGHAVAQDLALGVLIFGIGLVKKLLIADSLAVHANALFDGGAGAPGSYAAWTGLACYTLQIYFDFSGYSDMAIGLARMFGIKLPVNFDSPYKATSIIDFWRRWHITLSRFLRDYLYIPLGGNRRGRARRYLNLLITMLLGGLWHGAGWGFVLWGLIHGALLAANHLLDEVVPWRGNRYTRFAGWLVTLLCVMLAWVPFRAPTLADAVDIWGALLWPNPAAGAIDFAMLGWLVLGASLAFAMPNTQQLIEQVTGYRIDPGTYRATRGPAAESVRLRIAEPRTLLVMAGGLGAVSALALALNNRIAQFIYFQF